MVKEKIKIAYVVPALDAGGAERFILDLINNLDRAVFSPTLILFDHGGFFVAEAEAAGIDLVILKKRFKFDPINFCQLRRALKRLRPSIVHTQLGGDLYGRLAARMLHIPVIVSTEQNVQPRESGLMRRLKAWTGKWANQVVAISRAVKADMEKRYSLPAAKTRVIYNGLEIKKFLLEERRPVGAKIILGSLGRLTPQKNYSLLLGALAKLPLINWECRLAGEGELRPQLEAQIKELNLTDKVRLVGLKRNVKEFLSDLDIFVLPSSWEGLGIVLLEAGLAGLPVVASDVDGIKEIISDGDNGRLFVSGNVADLAAKLEDFIKNINQPEIKRLGDNLRASVKERFDIRNIVNQYQDLYQELLK